MTQRKRNGTRPQPGRRRAPGAPDDFAEFPFGYIARFGRMIEMRGTLGPEEHTLMMEAFVVGAEDLRREQEERRSRLMEILREVDAIDLLARASFTYLQIDPDTFKEWESDRSPAHIEYLALQVLGAGSPPPTVGVHPIRVSELTAEAIGIVRKMFQAASTLITMEAAAARRDRPNDPTVDYRLHTRLESLGVRGSGYSEHVKRVIHGCLDPFDRECRALMGFTASEALTFTYGLDDLVSDRIEPLLEEAAAGRLLMLEQLKRERRHPNREPRRFPDWLVELPPTKAKIHIGMFATIWLFADSRSLAVVTSDELAAKCHLDAPACQAFLDAFVSEPDLFNPQHHAFPGGAHPLTVQPILRVADGYVVPVVASMIEAIRPRMEDLLQQDRTVWDRYLVARSRYLETEATAMVRQALPGSRSWQGLKWRSSSDNSDVDGLVAADDLGVRLQCKSGRLHAPARRGAPEQMKRDIRGLIEDAARQHGALAAAISAEGAMAIGISAEQADALSAPLQVEMVVCLDDVTVWATETHQLRAYGALPHERHVPWVLSLTDLMVVVDLLQGGEFVHYALRRQRLERIGRIKAHDELDWVGHYLKEGLFFDGYFEDERSPDVFRLLSYTEPIDAWYFTREGIRTIAAPKPTHPLPPELASLVRHLELERPRHWILATVALLDGDREGREGLDRAISHARERLPQEGWSNASMLFDGGLGITLYIDLRTPWPEIRDRALDFCRKKAQDLDKANWIGIGEGATGPVFVVVIRRDPGVALADVFMDPPRSVAVA
jgi:hypothetical protein